MKKIYLAAFASLILLAGCSGTNPTLGLNDGMLMPCPDTPNCVNSQIVGSEEHSIEPIVYSGNEADARDKLLQILEGEVGAKTLATADNYVDAEYTSMFFRFVDDVEFYLVQEANDRTVIHVRSASRLGKKDFGVNRERIERIREKFNQ
ncbi:DUF1499 domain-containing protein [Vibrio sp. HN007]|uniref:DUF1499 domain-containing protein n=1 Tax=Vibrio iocasae TaxID=3098914 RepID=UPI0035D4EC86